MACILGAVEARGKNLAGKASPDAGRRGFDGKQTALFGNIGLQHAARTCRSVGTNPGAQVLREQRQVAVRITGSGLANVARGPRRSGTVASTEPRLRSASASF